MFSLTTVYAGGFRSCSTVNVAIYREMVYTGTISDGNGESMIPFEQLDRNIENLLSSLAPIAPTTVKELRRLLLMRRDLTRKAEPEYLPVFQIGDKVEVPGLGVGLLSALNGSQAEVASLMWEGRASCLQHSTAPLTTPTDLINAFTFEGLCRWTTITFCGLEARDWRKVPEAELRAVCIEGLTKKIANWGVERRKAADVMAKIGRAELIMLTYNQQIAVRRLWVERELWPVRGSTWSRDVKLSTLVSLHRAGIVNLLPQTATLTDYGERLGAALTLCKTVLSKTEQELLAQFRCKSGRGWNQVFKGVNHVDVQSTNCS